MVPKGGEVIDIGQGNSFGGAGEEEKVDDQVEREIERKFFFLLNQVETVNDIIDTFHYKETGFSKKDYMTYIKGYMKQVEEYLKVSKPDRIDGFKKGATELVKWVIKQFDEFTL